MFPSFLKSKPETHFPKPSLELPSLIERESKLGLWLENARLFRTGKCPELPSARPAKPDARCLKNGHCLVMPKPDI